MKNNGQIKKEIQKILSDAQKRTPASCVTKLCRPSIALLLVLCAALLGNTSYALIRISNELHKNSQATIELMEKLDEIAVNP